MRCLLQDESLTSLKANVFSAPALWGQLGRKTFKQLLLFYREQLFSKEDVCGVYVYVCVRCLDFNLKKVYEIAEVPLLMRLLSVRQLRFMQMGYEAGRWEGAHHTHISPAFLPATPHPFLCCTLHAGLTSQSCSSLHPASTLCAQIPQQGCSPVMHFCRIQSFQFICPDSITHLFISSLAHCLFICPFVIRSAYVYCLLCLSSIQQGLCPFGEIETDDW